MARVSLNKKVKRNSAHKSVKKRSVEATDLGSKQPVFRSDFKQTATLVKIGHTGAVNAIRSSKALGLPITYMQNGIIYREHPDGSKEIITERKAKIVSKEAKGSLKKGMIFHAK